MTSSTLTNKGYKKRLIEERLDTLLESFGAVEIQGAKWCGKTWLAQSRAKSQTKLDVENERAAAELDAALALAGETPHLIDEWQEVPEVWDACRRAVDDSGNKRGLYLLTGSTNLLQDKRKRVHHSGAGRIARITMRPMSLYEMENSTGHVSLSALFNGKKIEPQRLETSLADIAKWCCRGGWPGNLDLTDKAAGETSIQYIQSVLDINVVDENKSPILAEAFLKALAMNVGQAVTYKTLIADADGRDSHLVEATARAYLELFERLHLLENLPGWEPSIRAKARVRTKPKRYFVDPSLATALLGATPESLLHDTQTLGLLFETLVIRDLRVYLSTYSGLGNKVSYYRDEKGLEADSILEHEGKWAAIEIKLSDTKIEEGVTNLLALRRKVVENPAAQNAEPAFMAVIVGKGSLAYTRPDGIHVIPISTLTA